MPTLTLTLPKPHPAQAVVIDEASRFNVVCCGRRWGKTALGINRLATPETLSYPQGWFSPTYKMLLEVWRECTTVLAPIIKRKSVQERRLELITGGMIEFWSLDKPDAARGRKYRRIIVDEAAMVPGLMDAWQHVLRPTLADYKGDAWFLSTPKGRNGFWQMYQWGLDDNLPEWSSWQMPTSANPFIAPSEIEDMRRTMPERTYQQEILAHFIDDAGGVFRRVAEASTAVSQEKAIDGHQYIIGVDWAQQHDFTVLCVIDVTDRALVHLDRFNQIDYNVQKGRLIALVERFKPDLVIAETNSMGLPVIESLQRTGMAISGFTTTNATKAAAIDGLALSFERGDIKILNDPVLIAELQSYEMAKTATGLRKFSAPSGMHDDCVMALAIGWTGTAETYLSW